MTSYWREDLFGNPSDNLSSSLITICHQQTAFPRTIFSKWINFKTSHWKIFQILVDHRLAAFHQLLRLTKRLVHKAIWKSEESPKYYVSSAKVLSKSTFSKGMNFQTRHCKNFHCTLVEITLHFQTDCWSEAKILSPTLQLGFSTSLDLVNRENGVPSGVGNICLRVQTWKDTA